MSRGILRAAITIMAGIALPAQADGLIDNVNGYTLDVKGELQRFAAMVMTPDGKVASLLSAKDKRPKKLDWRYDGKGRTMLPGFVDAHAHVMALGMQTLQLDLGNATSLEEARAAISAYAAAHPEKRWVTGRGWDHEKWKLGRFPTAADLDDIVPDRPVWLVSADGERGWANSAAMCLANVGNALDSPSAGNLSSTGWIERLPDGRPAGVFTGTSKTLLTTHLPEPLPTERDQAFAKAQYQLLEAGITTVTDMGTTLADWNVFRRAADSGRMHLRIMAYADTLGTLLSIAGPKPTPWLMDGRIRMTGLYLPLDGSVAARTAWLKRPYDDKAGHAGGLLVGDAIARNLVSRAAMDGFQIAFRATGDAAVSEALGIVAEMKSTYVGDRRWRIEGAQVIDPAETGLLARDGIIVSVSPDALDGGTLLAQRLGERYNANPAQQLIHAKAFLTVGSWSPAHSPNLLPGMIAMNTGPDHRLTTAQILAVHTVNAAQAGFAQDRIGKLAPGYPADFILLDGDPLAVPSVPVGTISVVETWIDGRRRWSRKSESDHR